MKWNVIKKNWRIISAVLITISYFSYFVLPSLNCGFRNDDVANIYYYWIRGVKGLLQGLILFFAPYYRPVGGAYYYSIYELFGLNPLPYHIVIICLLAVNVVLVYHCARLLSGSRSIGWLCSILMAYHARMGLLAYVPAFIYDVLCFTFYFAALLYYLRQRTHDGVVTTYRLFIFLLLYVAALESKEMAVSLPVMIILYELIWHTPDRSLSRILFWLRHNAFPALLSGLLTLFFIIGKTSGSNSLTIDPSYDPTISFGNFVQSNIRFIKDYFYLNNFDWIDARWLLIIWAFMAIIALVLHSKHMSFAFVMSIIAALPIAFIPGRGGAMLYVPSFGWALLLATLMDRIGGLLSRILPSHSLSRDIKKSLLLLMAVCLIWSVTYSKNRKTLFALKHQGEVRMVKEQLQRILPSVEPGSKLAFYNDIFTSWEAKMITELLYKDRSVTVQLHEKLPLGISDFNRMDYVLAFEKDRIVILKHPGEKFVPPDSQFQPR